MKIKKVLLAALGFLGLGGAASAEDWDSFLKSAYDYLYQQQDILEKEYSLSEHKRWDFDQDSGELIFSNDGVPAVVAEFQFVGSISTTSDTWLWSWANSSIDERLSQKLDIVYEFGETNGFTKLIEEKWEANETDGWEMSAITNYLLKGEGVYRPPFDTGYSFMVITKIEKVTK